MGKKLKKIPESDIPSTVEQLHAIRAELLRTRFQTHEEIDNTIESADVKICRLIQRLTPREQ